MRKAAAFRMTSIGLGFAAAACSGADTESSNTGSLGQALGAGSYVLQFPSGKCLTVPGYAPNNGANVAQEYCYRTDNAQWQLAPRPDGSFRLIAEHSNKCAVALGSPAVDGDNIQQGRCIYQRSKWIVTDLGNDEIELRSAKSDLCAEVAGDSAADGANVVQGTCSGSGTQRIRATPASAECLGIPQSAGGAEVSSLIDDFEDGDNALPWVGGRVGYWYTYNDGTADGVQTPVAAVFSPTSGGANGTAYAARTSGLGFTTWGAGLGVSLASGPTRGCPYDASSRSGIGFYVKGVGEVRVKLATTQTTEASQGGTCEADCGDHFGVDLTLSTEWQYYAFEWSELTQQGWGAAATFDPSQIIAIQLQTLPDAVFDVRVDEIEFLDGVCASDTDCEAGNHCDLCTSTCQVTAPAELCNGVDDDCDPLTEDGADEALLGTICDTGLDGPCAAGTLQCTGGPSLTCVPNQVAATEICGNGEDDNCNGEVDETIDEDSDGWTNCDGDCCDVAGACSGTPELVNPGAFEVLGNGVDDDCDAASSDTEAPAPCSTRTTDLYTVTAAELAAAMDVCQVTTETEPLPTRRWGLVSAEFRTPAGAVPSTAQATSMSQRQSGVLVGYGTQVTPVEGSTMAILSSGYANDRVSPVSSALGYSGSPPAAYLAAHGGGLPDGNECPGSGPGSGDACASGTGANDGVNLRLRIRVPTNAVSLSYQFRFFAEDFFDYSCSPYNDFFLALLTTGASGIPADHNIAFDSLGNTVSLTGAFFDACSPSGCYTCPYGTAPLVGTGLCASYPCGGAGTTWLTSQAPVVGGELMELDLMVFDVADQYGDSLVILDNFEWGVTAATPGTGGS